MSKYEVLRLNGCDVSQYAEQPDYPHCEQHDLSSVEMSFSRSPIPFEANNPEFNWAAPGDCTRLNAEIAAGKGFNGRELDGCTLNGKFAGVKGSEGKPTTDIIAKKEQVSKLQSLEHYRAETISNAGDGNAAIKNVRKKYSSGIKEQDTTTNHVDGNAAKERFNKNDEVGLEQLDDTSHLGDRNAAMNNGRKKK